MEEFDLSLKISVSEKAFQEQIGKAEYDKIKEETFKRDKCTCCGCGYHPFDESKINKSLSLHVIEINTEEINKSECITLCIACHTTQHIDAAIKKEWIKLVNSTFSQKRLIEMCRINSFHSLKDDNLRYLQTTPEEYLKKILDDKIPSNTKTKVIFTSKFEWGDL